MARATFYYHAKRLSEPDGYDDVRAAIRKIYNQHKGRYGYRRITSQLRSDGIIVNHKKVQKLMVEMGLRGKRKKVKYKSPVILAVQNNMGSLFLGLCCQGLLQIHVRLSKATRPFCLN